MAATLPNEILDQCFGSLERKDLKSLRMVCWRFHDLSSRHLFKSLELSESEDSFGTFIRFTTNPNLQPCIEQIVLNKSSFSIDGCCSEETYWKARMRVAAEALGTILPVSQARSRSILEPSQAEQLFKQIVASSQKMTGAKRDLRALIAGLNRLPNLKTIILDDATRPATYKGIEYPELPRSLVKANHSRYSHIYQALFAPLEETEHQSLATVLRAIVISGKSIEHLVVETSQWEPREYMVGERLLSEQLSDIEVVGRHLTSLVISNLYRWEEFDGDDQRGILNMHHILTRVPHLRTLAIARDVGFGRTGERPESAIKHLLTCHWKQLETLHLEDIPEYPSVGALLDFVGRHEGLKKLHLRSLKVLGHDPLNGPPDVLEGMRKRNMNYPTLRMSSPSVNSSEFWWPQPEWNTIFLTFGGLNPLERREHWDTSCIRREYSWSDFNTYFRSEEERVLHKTRRQWQHEQIVARRRPINGAIGRMEWLEQLPSPDVA